MSSTETLQEKKAREAQETKEAKRQIARSTETIKSVDEVIGSAKQKTEIERDYTDREIKGLGVDLSKYPHVQKYAEVVHPPKHPIIGREKEMRSLLAALARPEVSNAFLVAEPGAGKSALVQGASMEDSRRTYMEVDLAKMSASEGGEDGAVQMATRIKSFFDEAIEIKQELESIGESGDLVFFMDEFHLLVQLSPAAAQSIKPILARSGERGIKIIAATTYEEFHEYVEKDQALTERLQRINLRQPTKEVTLQILRSIVKGNEMQRAVMDDTIYEAIVDYSNRYIPANSQPRKSILILDAMLGWHKQFGSKLDRHLLADVIYESSGIKVAFEVDGLTIKETLNRRVLDQKFAVSQIEQQLQIATADLHDETKPMASFLFAGSTGVGKAIDVDELVPVYEDHTGDRTISYKRHGDLCPGDWIFGRYGEPVEVVDNFPQGEIDAYRVVFEDGQSVVVNDEHLWSWRYLDDTSESDWKIDTTAHIMAEWSKKHVCIPINGAVQRPKADLAIDSYLYGLGADESLPAEYKTGSIHQRQALIRGLFTSNQPMEQTEDGSLVYGSVHESLAWDVVEVLSSLGVRSDVRKDEGDYNVIVQAKGLSVVDFLTFGFNKVEILEIRSIEPLNEKREMNCIMVDSDDHLYQVTKGHIVTHNTELAKQLANILFDDPNSFIRFDMSEYAREESVDYFREQVTTVVWNHSHSIVLFDEVEKAAPAVTRLMLQILDDGRMTNRQGRQVSFLNTYIILTTNAGQEIFKKVAAYIDQKGGFDNIDSSALEEHMKVIRRSLIEHPSFAPEILGRIDKLVPFTPLQPDTYLKIMNLKLEQLMRKVWRKHGVRLQVSAKVPKYLAWDEMDTSTDAGGARGLVSRLNLEVTSQVARYINLYPHVKNIGVLVEGDTQFENENIRKSRARIKVGTIQEKKPRA